MDYQSNQYQNQGFSIAAFVCGILSITLGCCYLSLPFGAMSLVFVCLNHKKGQPFDRYSKNAIVFSVIGILYGIIAIYLLYTKTLEMMQNPEYMNQLNRMYKQLYGADMQEILQNNPFFQNVQ